MFMKTDNMTVAQRLEQFDTKHGGDSIKIGGYYYYSDGAICEDNPYGALHEPPKDELKCLEVVGSYWDEKLNRATWNFTDHKQHLVAKANQGFRPTSQEMKKLTDFKQSVKRIRRKVKAIDDQYNNHPEIRRRRELDALRQQTRLSALVEVNSIEI